MVVEEWVGAVARGLGLGVVAVGRVAAGSPRAACEILEACGEGDVAVCFDVATACVAGLVVGHGGAREAFGARPCPTAVPAAVAVVRDAVAEAQQCRGARCVSRLVIQDFEGSLVAVVAPRNNDAADGTCAATCREIVPYSPTHQQPNMLINALMPFDPPYDDPCAETRFVLWKKEPPATVAWQFPVTAVEQNMPPPPPTYEAPWPPRLVGHTRPVAVLTAGRSYDEMMDTEDATAMFEEVEADQQQQQQQEPALRPKRAFSATEDSREGGATAHVGIMPPHHAKRARTLPTQPPAADGNDLMCTATTNNNALRNNLQNARTAPPSSPSPRKRLAHDTPHAPYLTPPKQPRRQTTLTF